MTFRRFNLRLAAATLIAVAPLIYGAVAQAESGENESSDGDVVARARTTCEPGTPCPLFRDVARRAQKPDLDAIRLLGELDDPRAAGLLLQLSAYGPNEEVRRVAEQALVSLAQAPGGARAIDDYADSPDPEVEELAKRYAAYGAGPNRRRPDRGARASEPSRVVFGRTALGREKNTGAWTSFNLGAHRFEHAVTSNLELGFQTVVPIGIYAALPQARLTTSLSDGVHLGIFATGGVVGTYLESGTGAAVVYGGPVLTLGDERLFFNASLGVAAGETYGGVTSDGGWLFLPNLGFSARVSNGVRFNLEVASPLGPDLPNGEIWGVLYGLRVFGDELFGDISFFVPLFDGAGGVLKYAPLGFPLLSFGANW